MNGPATGPGFFQLLAGASVKTMHDMVAAAIDARRKTASGASDDLLDHMLAAQDPETGQRRRLFLRPSLLARIKQSFAERREELTQMCIRYGREPFFLLDRFDPDAMTRYFY